MREIRLSGSEGGVALTTPSLPLSQSLPAGGGTQRTQRKPLAEIRPGQGDSLPG